MDVHGGGHGQFLGRAVGMIDEKDIEIAKLRGQVEQLEKLIKTLMVAPPQPQFIPYPVPCVPHIQPTYPQPLPWTTPYDFSTPFWCITNDVQYTS